MFQHGKHQEQNCLKHSQFGKETSRQLYLFVHPEPCLGVDALLLLVLLGVRDRGLPSTAWSVPATLASYSPKWKRGVGFLLSCWEKDSLCWDHQTGRVTGKWQEAEGQQGLDFFPASVLPLKQQHSHTWSQSRVRPEMHNPLSLLKGCHRKVKPDEIRWGTPLRLAGSSKRHLM